MYKICFVFCNVSFVDTSTHDPIQSHPNLLFHARSIIDHIRHIHFQCNLLFPSYFRQLIILNASTLRRLRFCVAVVFLVCPGYVFAVDNKSRMTSHTFLSHLKFQVAFLLEVTFFTSKLCLTFSVFELKDRKVHLSQWMLYLEIPFL